MFAFSLCVCVLEGMYTQYDLFSFKLHYSGVTLFYLPPSLSHLYLCIYTHTSSCCPDYYRQ